MKRVLVTGATGFLGGHILEQLRTDPGVQVIAACRRADRLDPGFDGESRVGDLTDPAYRRAVVQGVDVICHPGTWAAFWGHRSAERQRFYGPALDLIDHAVQAGVGRFVLASTVAAGAPRPVTSTADRDAPAPAARFWPHLNLLIELDRQMRLRAASSTGAGTQMVTLRLGHFVGPGNEIGLVPALMPRLRTRVTPWLAGGLARVPLVTGPDLGRAFACAVHADLPERYDSFAVCGPEFPTAREVITFLAEQAAIPPPRFSVPYPLAHSLAMLCEMTHPVMPGKAPFLTRSLVHLARDWWCPDQRATDVLGYVPSGDWRAAARAAIAQGAPASWPALVQQ